MIIRKIVVEKPDLGVVPLPTNFVNPAPFWPNHQHSADIGKELCRPLNTTAACLANKDLDKLALGQGEPCVLPFYYNSMLFSSCVDSAEDFGEFWCPTKVNSHGEISSVSPHWGYCSEACPADHLFKAYPSE